MFERAGQARAPAAGQQQLEQKERRGNDAAGSVRRFMDPRPEGWTGFYQSAPHGTRTLEEFEALVLRRIEALSRLFQEKGRGHLSYPEILGLVKEGTLREPGKAEGESPFQLFPPGVWEECTARAEEAARDEACKDADGRVIIAHTRELAELLRKGTDAGRLTSAQAALLRRYNGDGRDPLRGGDEGAYKRHLQKERAALWQRSFDDDVISHFACRLAFSGEEKWRRWFADNEDLLFRGRVSALNAEQRREMIEHSNTGADLLDAAMKAGVSGLLAEMERLKLGPYALKTNGEAKSDNEIHAFSGGLQSQDVYRVNFTAVARLVRDRKVVVRGGKALLTHHQVLELLFTKFRACVSRGLAEAVKQRPQIEQTERDRVCAFLDLAVRQCSMGQDDGDRIEEGAGVVSVEDVAANAERHMPLCMRQVDRHLRKEKHLKWDGRFQYGIFLKRLGLTQEELTKFMGENMTLKGGGLDKFAKGPYGYAIRHWYGREGKKTSYNAQGCANIVNGAAPKAGQCHGCPYRHSDESSLRALLRERRTHPLGDDKKDGFFGRAVQLGDKDIDAIVKKAKDGHYTAACHMYFTRVHAPYPEGSSLFASPFHYWDASVKWARDRTEETRAAEAAAAAPGGEVTPRARKLFAPRGGAPVTPPGMTSPLPLAPPADAPSAPKRGRY